MTRSAGRGYSDRTTRPTEHRTSLFCRLSHHLPTVHRLLTSSICLPNTPRFVRTVPRCAMELEPSYSTGMNALFAGSCAFSYTTGLCRLCMHWSIVLIGVHYGVFFLRLVRASHTGVTCRSTPRQEERTLKNCANSRCAYLRTSVAGVAAHGGPISRLPDEGLPCPVTNSCVNSILYVVQAMNEDHAGAIESFWRCLDVELRYPGLCRSQAW